MTEDSPLSELRSIRLALGKIGGRAGARFAPVHLTLAHIERGLSRPVRLAVLGDQNSGKSLLINYLLKHQVLPSGGFAGEGTQLLIRYAGESSVHAVRPDGTRNRLTSKAFGRLAKPEMRGAPPSSAVIYDARNSKGPGAQRSPGPAHLIFPSRPEVQAPSRLIEIGLPLGFLQRVEIVEVRACPEGPANHPSNRAFRQVDMAIWCTLATQAWKESEAASWKRIPAGRRKSALMLVTYKDAIRHGKDEAKITARLRHEGSGLFDHVVLVSLRDAIQSLLVSDREEARQLHRESNVEAAESAITGLIRSWQTRRFQKTARLLRRLAARVAVGRPEQGGSANHELASILNRLAADFSSAAPSISLENKAA